MGGGPHQRGTAAAGLLCGGVRSAASCQPLRDLIHKAEIPATYTLMAAGVVPYGDPMNIGMVGMHGCYTSNRAVADCDVLIAVGTRFSDRVALNPKTFAKERNDHSDRH